MPLRFPQEVVVESFLPTFRAALARALRERGLTQQATADHLGLRQAAISKYEAGDVRTDPTIEADPRFASTVEELADGLATGRLGRLDILDRGLELIAELEDRGPVCTLHEEATPELAGLGCDLCIRGPTSSMRAEQEVLANVRRAARKLAAAPGMVDHVPNVGTNVGMVLDTGTDVDDVAAIPGRIYAMQGRIEVPAAPAFGASQHVADVVLAARAVDADVRGAVNLATSDALIEAASDPLVFDAAYDGRRARLTERFEEAGAVPGVAYHEGGFGIEPIAYVLGTTAVEAVQRAIQLVAPTSEGDSP